MTNCFDTGSDDATARLWKIESIDVTPLTLEDVILLAKVHENDNSFESDTHAIERL